MLREGRAVGRDVPRTKSIFISSVPHCHSQKPTVALMAVALCVSCRPAPRPPPALDAAAATEEVAAPRAEFVSPIENVVNPWLWTSASGATDDDKAIEDIGPYEPMPNMAGAVNTNAH